MTDTLATIGGSGLAVRSIERRPSAYQSSCSLDEMDVRFEDGSAMALVAKAVDWDAMCSDAQRARPRWLWDEDRERAVYESILSSSNLATPRYLGSYVNESGIEYLLLERIDGAPLWQSGDIDTWREAARWLARLHARIPADAIARTSAAPHLLRYDRAFYDTWLERALTFQGGSSAAVHQLSEPYRKVVDVLLREPQSFLHGEFYSSNVLVEPARGLPGIVRPVDWDLAAIGPASIDLACLLAGRWTDEARADLADAYHRELAALAGAVQSRERYLRTLDYSLIHLSVRNLGWSIDWTPPPDRAHDWLGEALRLCEKWDL